MSNVVPCSCGCGEPALYAAQHCPTPFPYAIEERGHPTPCWIFQNHRGQERLGSYARISIDGVRTVIHRLMYERDVGHIPDGLVLDHLCRQTLCIRPSHLEPVTPAENARRVVHPRKLSPDAAAEIRRLPRQYGNAIVAARKHGVHEALVSQIRSGKIYRDR